MVRPSFAAYGERRDGSDWDGPPSSADLTAIGNISRRGFTGHEHLDAVGLIHMNGRVYEPVAGRFLSVDPLIDGFDSSQGPNSFAYVHNNPLTFSDPFGLSHNCEDVTGCSHGDGWWDECDWGGPWMAGWSPSCEDQYYLGPQGDEVVDITGPGSGQNPTPLTPAEAWDGVISGGTGMMYGAELLADIGILARDGFQQFDQGAHPLHRYTVFNEICDAARQYGCSAAYAFDEGLLRYPAPGFDPAKKVVSEQRAEVPGFGGVRFYVFAEEKTVINATLPDHKLHPGYVERSIVEIDGRIFIRTRGFGTGPYGGLNVAGARSFWGAYDALLIRSLSGIYPPFRYGR